jgi:hypothetical protein
MSQKIKRLIFSVLACVSLQASAFNFASCYNSLKNFDEDTQKTVEENHILANTVNNLYRNQNFNETVDFKNILFITSTFTYAKTSLSTLIFFYQKIDMKKITSKKNIDDILGTNLTEFMMFLSYSKSEIEAALPYINNQNLRQDTKNIYYELSNLERKYSDCKE